MQVDAETDEKVIEVDFKFAWYGDILRKPGVHMIPYELRDQLPSSATILSVLEEDEFEEVPEVDEAATHAHKMKPIPLSEVGKSQAKSAAPQKKPARQYQRKEK
jgi:hypothetical protein